MAALNKIMLAIYMLTATPVLSKYIILKSVNSQNVSCMFNAIQIVAIVTYFLHHTKSSLNEFDILIQYN